MIHFIFAEVSDSAAIAITNIIVGLIGTMFASIMSYLLIKLNNQAKQAAVLAENAAVKVSEVKTTLKDNVSTITTGVNQVKQVLKDNNAELADKVKGVKDDLSAANESTSIKLEDLAKVGNKTLHLVNSAMENQLRITAIALRRIAELTNHADDLEAARLAEISYEAMKSKSQITTIQ